MNRLHTVYPELKMSNSTWHDIRIWQQIKSWSIFEKTRKHQVQFEMFKTSATSRIQLIGDSYRLNCTEIDFSFLKQKCQIWIFTSFFFLLLHESELNVFWILMLLFRQNEASPCAPEKCKMGQHKRSNLWSLFIYTLLSSTGPASKVSKVNSVSELRARHPTSQEAEQKILLRWSLCLQVFINTTEELHFSLFVSLLPFFLFGAGDTISPSYEYWFRRPLPWQQKHLGQPY